MKVKFKVWIEDEQGKQLVGEGLERLLTTVAETGSINKAAAELNMSYRTAWAKIQKAETRLGHLLLAKQTGGAQGGGSHLTREGCRLLEAYIRFHAAAEKELLRLFQEHFHNDLCAPN